MLLLLGLIPLFAALYILALRRRRRVTVRYSSLALVRAALPRYSWLRRHLPFALFLAALASLIIAAGRPYATIDVPAGRSTIILAMDISRSMRALDIPPSRLEAAQEAALSFIARQELNTQIGIVGFAGFAEMIQAPTTEQEALESAIGGLTLGRGTAVGAGILRSIDVIARSDPSIAPSDGAPLQSMPADTYAPAIIVVLTDGVSTTGPSPIDAAQQAALRGIRIYTIGFGTDQGMGGQALGVDPQFSQQFGGGFRRGIDEETLQEIAEITGGTYYSPESASELVEVFQQLPTYLTERSEETEVSFAFIAFGALLAALAVGLAFRWNPFL
jgi:Ca-activated chloride channel family protein